MAKSAPKIAVREQSLTKPIRNPPKEVLNVKTIKLFAILQDAEDKAVPKCGAHKLHSFDSQNLAFKVFATPKADRRRARPWRAGSLAFIFGKKFKGTDRFKHKSADFLFSTPPKAITQ